MLKPRFIIGFSGHRSGYEETLIAPALSMALETLKQQAIDAGGQAELYASVAEGTDTLCVEAARSLNIPVHLLLPLPEAEFEKDFSGPDAWDRSRAQIEIARRHPGEDSIHLVPGESTRPECYFNQAMHMLEACDVLLLVWNGQPSKGLGGTTDVFDQATTIRLPTITIDATSGKICPLAASPFQSDPIINELNKIAVEKQAPCAAEAPTPDHLQQCLDEIALVESSRFRPSVVIMILLHGLAALLAALVLFSLQEKHHWFMERKWVFALIEFALVTAALWMNLRLHRRHTQERWLRCRFACEIVRSLRACVPLIDPLHPQIIHHDRSWSRFALSVGLLCQAHQPTDDPIVLRDAYLATRLSNSHPESQIFHYEQHKPAATRWWEITRFIGNYSALLAPFFVLLTLVNKLDHLRYKNHDDPAALNWEKPFWGWITVVFLPIALPLVAGVASGIRQALDAGRRKHRYPQMVERLRALQLWLRGLKTPSSISTAVIRTEEILLDELLEWQLSAKNSGGH